MLMPFTNNGIEVDPESVTKSHHITVGKVRVKPLVDYIGSLN